MSARAQRSGGIAATERVTPTSSAVMMSSPGLEVWRGRVAHLRRSMSVHGGGDRRDVQVSTKQVSIFEIEGRAVSYSDAKGMIVKEGDEVIVAGRHSQGNLLDAVAYRNLSVGVNGNVDYWNNLPAVLMVWALCIVLSVAILWFCPYALLTLLSCPDPLAELRGAYLRASTMELVFTVVGVCVVPALAIGLWLHGVTMLSRIHRTRRAVRTLDKM